MKSGALASFAKGGKDKMFKPQAAGAAAPARTGKIQSPAPGAKSAAGGPQQRGHSKSTPALAGHSGPGPKKER